MNLMQRKNKFWKIIKFLCILCLCFAQCSAKHLNKEQVYQNVWCNERNGITEYKLEDKSRVDCLLPDSAVEFDFASKRDECLGQALRYGAYTNKKAACVLILENEKDKKYLNQLLYTIEANKLDVKVYTITFEELKNHR